MPSVRGTSTIVPAGPTLTARRIAKAMELFGDVALKVYDIADRVGYRDTDDVAKVLKKHVGMTPTGYRNAL